MISFNRLHLVGMTFLALSVVGAAADTIRGSAVRTVVVEAKEEVQPNLSVKAEEIAAVQLSGDTSFLTGIDVEVVVSEALRRYADSFAVTLYSGLTPRPGPETTVMEGRRELFQVLPYSSRIYLHIPLQGGVGSPAEVYSPERPVSDGSFPLALLFTPIMKGVPDSVLDRAFFLTFKPVVAQRGVVDLAIVRPSGFENAPIEVLLGTQKIEPDGELLELDVGIHQLEVISTAFKRQTTSFAVVAGQTTRVEVILEPQMSYLTIERIEGAQTFLDGERIDDRVGQSVELTEGTHSVRFKLGDTSVSKRFDVLPGRTYRISLVLDIVLKEE